MAVSKRTRFEVLRRDKSTCRYCGAKAPDVELHVDHVTPVALGGNDDPSNLVAACVDCNRGKASTKPDEDTVADVSEDAMRWARAVEEAASSLYGLDDEAEAAAGAFLDEWETRTAWHGEMHALPDNWRATVVNYARQGLPLDQISHAASVALNARGVNSSARFPYFCGVCRKKVERLHEAARSIMDAGGES